MCGSVLVWHDGKVLRSIPAHEGAIFSLFQCAAGFATGGKDGRVRLWQPDFEPLATIDMNTLDTAYAGKCREEKEADKGRRKGMSQSGAKRERGGRPEAEAETNPRKECSSHHRRACDAKENKRRSLLRERKQAGLDYTHAHTHARRKRQLYTPPITFRACGALALLGRQRRLHWNKEQ